MAKLCLILLACCLIQLGLSQKGKPEKRFNFIFNIRRNDTDKTFTIDFDRGQRSTRSIFPNQGAAAPSQNAWGNWNAWTPAQNAAAPTPTWNLPKPANNFPSNSSSFSNFLKSPSNSGFGQFQPAPAVPGFGAAAPTWNGFQQGPVTPATPVNSHNLFNPSKRGVGGQLTKRLVFAIFPDRSQWQSILVNARRSLPQDHGRTFNLSSGQFRELLREGKLVLVATYPKDKDNEMQSRRWWQLISGANGRPPWFPQINIPSTPAPPRSRKTRSSSTKNENSKTYLKPVPIVIPIPVGVPIRPRPSQPRPTAPPAP